MTDMSPNEAGHYWAKWRIPCEGTADNGECCNGVHADWEVVQVFENCLDKDDEEYLMVAVPGVAKGQPLENFFWGERIIKP